jgi:hypothetical protein
MLPKNKKTKCEIIQMILKYKPETPQCGLWLKTRKELIIILKELREKEKSNE